MEKKIESKLYTVLITILKWALLICFISLFYMLGVINGMLTGVEIGLNYNNQTLCDMFITESDLDIYYDSQGYCVINDDAKYNEDVICPWGNFRIIGEKDMNYGQEILSGIEHIVYYPAFRGCK